MTGWRIAGEVQIGHRCEVDVTLLIHFAAALFAILNPLGNLPVFISSTAGERPGTQRYLALFLSVFVIGMLLVFL